MAETLSQETKRLEKAAKLHEEVQGYMREMGIDETPPPTTTEGKKAVALDANLAPAVDTLIKGAQ